MKKCGRDCSACPYIKECKSGYVNNLVHNATGTHFTQQGHSLANVQIVALEQIKKNCDQYRKGEVEYFIRKFNTVMNGLNRKY